MVIEWILIAVSIFGAVWGGIYGFKIESADSYNSRGTICMVTILGAVCGCLLGGLVAAIGIFFPIVMAAMIAATLIILKMEKVRQDSLKKASLEAKENNSLSNRRLNQMTSEYF